MSEENTLKQNEAEHGLDLVTKIGRPGHLVRFFVY